MPITLIVMCNSNDNKKKVMEGQENICFLALFNLLYLVNSNILLTHTHTGATGVISF